MNALRVAVLAGGPSREAEVSRSSAREVADALTDRHVALLIELDQDTSRALTDFGPDVVFPVLHGPPGEDGTVQGYLEVLGLPYVGSGVHASAVAMDKSVAKALFRRAGLPVCEELIFAVDVDPNDAAELTRAALGDRVVIKPLRQGSAIGVTPVINGGDLATPLKTALDLGGGVLVEPYVMGHEVTVGVLDLFNEPLETLPPIEVRTPEGTWYDYTHRYTEGHSDHLIPAPLPGAVLDELQRISADAHQVLECHDLSRADFIVTDDEQIVLLEVNTLPGMTPTSLFPDAAAAVGIPFNDLADRLVRSAARRGPRM